jgi:hypothetical protein
MEGHQFDAIVKVLGTTGARRRLLAGILGTALAGRFGAADAGRKSNNGKRCGRNGQCTSNHCCFANPGDRWGTCRECCEDSHCTAPQTCGGGSSLCAGQCCLSCCAVDLCCNLPNGCCDGNYCCGELGCCGDVPGERRCCFT